MGKKGILAIVSPAEWRDRTSLTFSGRSGSTQTLDKAYDAYYLDRSEFKATALHDALRDYLRQHGGYWERCERDKVSGGLLRYLFEQTRPAVGAAASRAAELDRKAQARIENEEIPHSRLGVLYLLSNIEIELDILPTVIEGVGAVGGAVGVPLATNYNQLKDVKNVSPVAFKAFGKDVSGRSIVAGGQGVAQLAGGLTRSPVKALPPPAVPVPSVPEKPWFPRTLVELERAAARVEDADAWARRHRMRYATRGLVQMGAGAISAVPVVYGVVDDLATHGAALYRMVKDALTSAWQGLQAKMLANGTWLSEKLASVAKMAIKFVLGQVLSKAAPVIGGVMEMGRGIVRTIQQAAVRIQSHMDRQHFKVMPGHPEELANAIEKQMNWGIARGVGDTLKGVASTALAVTLPGLGSLVSAVVSGVEWLARLLWRVAEYFAIGKFLADARKLYADAKGQAKKKESLGIDKDRNAVTMKRYELPTVRTGILFDTTAFTEFFRRGCSASPLIPMLTLNSGICGSLMTMMKMFDDSGMVGAKGHRLDAQRPFDLTQKDATGRIVVPASVAEREKHTGAFDHGERYFTRLKQYSATYLKASGFQVGQHKDADPAIQGFIKHALDHHTSASSHTKTAKLVAALGA